MAKSSILQRSQSLVDWETQKHGNARQKTEQRTNRTTAAGDLSVYSNSAGNCHLNHVIRLQMFKSKTSNCLFIFNQWRT